MKHYFSMANHIYYVMPDEVDVIETQSMIQNKTMRFWVALQSFAYVDEPIVCQVDIGENTFRPIDKQEWMWKCSWYYYQIHAPT